MTIDVIMLAKGSTGNLKSMTQQAINSIHAAEKDIQFNIIVVETIKDVTYKHCTVVHPDEKFNYNKFTKIGLRHLSGADYVYFVNNDTKAHYEFAKHLVNGLLIYDSVSPVNPMMPEHRNKREQYIEGFQVRELFCGWAFMVKRTLLDEINHDVLFPDEIEGWYSDNWFADVLANHGKRHALVSRAKVDHLESKTIRSLSREEHDRITYEQKKNYDKLLGGLE